MTVTVEQRVGRLESQDAIRDIQYGQVLARLSVMESTQSEHSEALDELKQGQDTLSERLDGLTSQVGVLQDDVNVLKADMAMVLDRLGTIVSLLGGEEDRPAQDVPLISHRNETGPGDRLGHIVR